MAKSTLEEKYQGECIGALRKEFGYKNQYEIPKLSKIVINCSLKEFLQDSKILDSVMGDISAIAGQKPVVRRAKKSISNFKLRAGQPIGLSVTLRRKKMYEFFNKLVNIALPRMRDFKGVNPMSFDKRGNYTMGFTEQIIFPEVNPDKASKVFGMDVTFVTTANTDDEGKALLKLLGMPFRGQNG